MKYSVIPSVITSRFWDGTKEIEQNGQKVKVTLSLQTPVGREEAIQRAIKDLMARTLTRREETKEWDFNQAVKDVLLPKLNEWLKDDRTDFSEEAFDTWHAGSCKAVLDVLREYYTNNDNDGSDVQYGKAQKIVNMTMKGLYCLKDAEKKNRYFEHCHIALDSFTLEWIQRSILEPQEVVRGYLAFLLQSWSAPERFRKYRHQSSFSEKDHQKEQMLRCVMEGWEDKLKRLDQDLAVYDQRRISMKVNPAKQMWRADLQKQTEGWLAPKFVKDCVSNWSLIPEKTTSVYGYGEYVRWVRNYFMTNHAYQTEAGEKLTSFQAEFYIWPEIQLHLAAEALLFELNPDTYKGKEETPTQARADVIKLSAEDLVAKVKDEIHTYEQKHKE